jgi:hypothetical protein
MPDPDWIPHLLPDATAHLDVNTIDRLACLLHLDCTDVLVGVRSILRQQGYDVSPFELRTNTWRLDLPATVIRAVLGGIVSATIITALGVPNLPIALLSLAAPLLFSIRRVEVDAGDLTIYAELHAAVGDQPHRIDALYQQLPARTRAELTLIEFGEIVERLLDARLAATGADGVRLRAAGDTGGFRLALSTPPLVSHLLAVTALPGATAAAPAVRAPAMGTPGTAPSSQPGLLLGEGRPRVFISYAQESETHMREVLTFAECLHRSGVGVVLDQDAAPYRDDWQLWATRSITGCDYVLVIASPMCRLVGDGAIDPEQHKGLQAEMRTLRDLYNSDHPYWLRRVLPVILPGGTVDGIPLFLQPHNADHYRVVSLDEVGTTDLMRTLTAL